MKIYMGIDPGAKGAIVVINSKGILMEMFPLEFSRFYTYLNALKRHDYDYDELIIGVEKCQAMRMGEKAQGAKSMFTYGTGYGKILGSLEVLEFAYTLISPQTWSKVIHAGTLPGKAKAKSLEAAKRLYPKIDFRATPRCKKEHDGFIDARHIAEFLRRQYEK
jgi:hypothetical protein